MVCKSFSEEHEVKVSAHRLWTALVNDSHNFLPKCEPDKIVSVEYEGKAGEVGSVRIIKFRPGPQGFTHVKEKLEEVDHAKLRVKFSVIEGGLSAMFPHAKIELEFKEGPGGTTIVHSKVEYEAVGDQTIPEEQKAGATASLKAAEAYLLTHNDYA